MKANLKRLIFLAVFLAVLIVPYLVFAQGGAPAAINNMKTVAGSGGFETASIGASSLSTIAGRIVAAVLSLLGVLFISLMIYGGGLWMTAQGNEDQVSKAKNVIKNSMIGLIVIVSAGAIFLVIDKIFRNNIGT